jgi:hypothetical protein
MHMFCAATNCEKLSERLNTVPQAVPLSMCQQIAHRTGYGTDGLVSTARRFVVFETIVL